jgi:hypothetical protein
MNETDNEPICPTCGEPAEWEDCEKCKGEGCKKCRFDGGRYYCPLGDGPEIKQ